MSPNIIPVDEKSQLLLITASHNDMQQLLLDPYTKKSPNTIEEISVANAIDNTMFYKLTSKANTPVKTSNMLCRL